MYLETLSKLLTKHLRKYAVTPYFNEGFFFNDITITLLTDGYEHLITITKSFDVWYIELKNKELNKVLSQTSIQHNNWDEINIIYTIIDGYIDFVKGNKLFEDHHPEYSIYLRSDEFDKVTLYLKDKDEAKKLYNKIAKTGKITLREVIDHSESEKYYFEKYKNKAQDGYPGDDDLDTPKEVYSVGLYGPQDEFIEAKDFTEE